MSAQEPGRVEVGDVFEFPTGARVEITCAVGDQFWAHWPETGNAYGVTSKTVAQWRRHARLIRRGGRAWPEQQEQEGE